MIDKLLSNVAPHICCGCENIGTLLCNNCKYNIVSEPYNHCLGCGRPAGLQGICSNCRLPYSRAWCVGERSGAIEALINDYKFNRAKAGYRSLVDLLLEILPDLPDNMVVVPIPTIPTHIRQRGYDHTLLIAREVARQRNLEIKQLLTRQTSATQRGAHRAERIKQAKQAFALSGDVQSGVPYLIVDDVLTTGATLTYAAKKLREAGATDVWAAIIARSPLD